MIKNNFSVNENRIAYNSIFNNTLNEILDYKINLENLITSIFECELYQKVKKIKNLFSREIFILLLNSYINSNNKKVITHNFNNITENSLVKHEKISIINFSNFCMEYNISDKNYIFLNDFPKNFFDNENNFLINSIIIYVYPEFEEITEEKTEIIDLDENEEINSNNESEIIISQKNSFRCNYSDTKKEKFGKNFESVKNSLNELGIISLNDVTSKKLENSKLINLIIIGEVLSESEKRNNLENEDLVETKNKILEINCKKIKIEEINKVIINKIRLFLFNNHTKFINDFEKLIFLVQTKITIIDSKRFINIVDLIEFIKSKGILEINFLDKYLSQNEITSINNLEDLKNFFPYYVIKNEKIDLDELKYLINDVPFEQKLIRITDETKFFFEILLKETLLCKNLDFYL